MTHSSQGTHTNTRIHMLGARYTLTHSLSSTSNGDTETLIKGSSPLHTHTHTHTHTPKPKPYSSDSAPHSDTQTHTHALSFSYTHTHNHTHTILDPSQIATHTHRHRQTHTNRSSQISHTCSLALTHTNTHCQVLRCFLSTLWPNLKTAWCTNPKGRTGQLVPTQNYFLFFLCSFGLVGSFRLKTLKTQKAQVIQKIQIHFKQFQYQVPRLTTVGIAATIPTNDRVTV